MPPLPVGSKLRNRYRIGKVLYQSRLVNVYSVDDLHLTGRIWGVRELKLLTADLADRARQVAQLQAAAVLLSNLNHPRIAKAVDFFSEGDNFYLVREQSAACDLETIMRRMGGAVPQESALAWIAQACEAMEYLLLRKLPGIFYRELRPSNILVSNQGSIKIIDLGMATPFQLGDDPSSLLSGGAVEYAAPEVFDGTGHDARSLVYTLGALLFHLLTGISPAESPFRLPPVTRLNPYVDEAVAALVEKATRLKPEERFQHPAEMRREIEKLLQGSAADHSTPFAAPRPAAWPWILAALLVIIMGTGFWYFYDIFLR